MKSLLVITLLAFIGEAALADTPKAKFLENGKVIRVYEDDVQSFAQRKDKPVRYAKMKVSIKKTQFDFQTGAFNEEVICTQTTKIPVYNPAPTGIVEVEFPVECATQLNGEAVTAHVDGFIVINKKPALKDHYHLLMVTKADGSLVGSFDAQGSASVQNLNLKYLKKFTTVNTLSSDTNYETVDADIEYLD